MFYSVSRRQRHSMSDTLFRSSEIFVNSGPLLISTVGVPTVLITVGTKEPSPHTDGKGDKMIDSVDPSTEFDQHVVLILDAALTAGATPTTRQERHLATTRPRLADLRLARLLGLLGLALLGLVLEATVGISFDDVSDIAVWSTAVAITGCPTASGEEQ
jgi:hypothetical protein